MIEWLCDIYKKRKLIPSNLEDEASLFSLATEYLAAAQILNRTPMVRVNHSSATLYLIGHAAELALKSYLFKRGESVESLAGNFRHDLKRLLSQARRRGLPDSMGTEHLKNFSSAYRAKRLEYRQNKEIKLPDEDALLAEVKMLVSFVFGEIFEFD